MEESGHGDVELVVPCPTSRLGGDGDGVTAAQEVRGLEAGVEERPFKPRYPAAEGELVAVLLLHLEGDVDGVVPPGVGLEVGGPLYGLKVAELVDPLDRELQGLGVQDVALVQEHLAPDDLVPRAVVARE